METKIVGLWDVYWENQGGTFPYEQVATLDEATPIQDEILNYLKNGHKIISKRSLSICLVTGDIIGSPTIFCDNYFIWTSEYIHYLELGILGIHANFLKNIQVNNFIVPSLTKEYLIGINQMLISKSFPPLPQTALKAKNYDRGN